MKEFEHFATDDLPAMFVELDLDEDIRQVLTEHADQLKDWMAGILAWHRRTARYPEEGLRIRYRHAEVDFSFSAHWTGNVGASPGPRRFVTISHTGGRPYRLVGRISAAHHDTHDTQPDLSGKVHKHWACPNGRQINDKIGPRQVSCANNSEIEQAPDTRPNRSV